MTATFLTQDGHPLSPSQRIVECRPFVPETNNKLRGTSPHLSRSNEYQNHSSTERKREGNNGRPFLPIGGEGKGTRPNRPTRKRGKERAQQKALHPNRQPRKEQERLGRRESPLPRDRNLPQLMKEIQREPPKDQPRCPPNGKISHVSDGWQNKKPRQVITMSLLISKEEQIFQPSRMSE